MTFFLFPHLHTQSKRIFFPPAIRLSAKLADALVAVSENTRQDAIRILAVPPEKITTTVLGVGAEFHPITNHKLIEVIQHRHQLPDEFILYIGTVEPRKNLPLLIKTYKRVREQEPNTMPLVIVGQLGWNYQEVFQFVEENNLEKEIHFAGYISTEDLPAVYNAASIFIYPTLYEGVGLPPLEAMACGTPVITSSVSSIPEYIGNAGVLVPPGDEYALSEALLQLMNDSEKRRQYAKLGPIQARKFTWKKTAQATLEVYQHVLNS